MSSDLTIRNANPDDFETLSDLIQWGARVHQHLDWRPPLEWLGSSPFLVLESGQSVLAALSCVPESPNLAWVRLFAYSVEMDVTRVWRMLFQKALESFGAASVPTITALSFQSWFTHLLLSNRFRHLHDIVVLQWNGEEPGTPPLGPEYSLRPMRAEELDEVERVDHDAFDYIWQNSLSELDHALQISEYASVIRYKNQAVAYQISTASRKSMHLARLAVLKDFQGNHLGSALVKDLLNEAQQRAMTSLTVNTQHTNEKSLALYKKMNFLRTREHFPVLVYAP